MVASLYVLMSKRGGLILTSGGLEGMNKTLRQGKVSGART